MKKIVLKSSLILFVLALFGSSYAFADSASVTITEPENGATVSGPVKVCMEVHGVEVQPAKEGVHSGKGHHHILVDVDLPADLTQPIGKDKNHIHMGDGSTCKTIKLDAGHHVIRTLFASGNHVPLSPVVTDTVEIMVE